MKRSEVAKVINWVNQKTTTEHSVEEFFNCLFEGKTSRQEINKIQDTFVNCFVDDGYYNYYNYVRVAQGKVKRFLGNNPKDRIINALEQLKEEM